MTKMAALQKTPRQLGYFMPAEWDPHEGTWLSWPHNEETWPAEMLPRMEDLWARIAGELSHGEKVHINVANGDMEKRATALLKEHGVNLQEVSFHHFPTNDAWVRDHGPIFIMKKESPIGQLALTDWKYNAWGGKYPPFDKDNQVPSRVAELLKVNRYTVEMILEGGSIEVNGQGLLFTTESCLLNPNRNPHLSRSQIEEQLMEFLGVDRVLWLEEGIVGDDTDGHIDDFVRWVGSKALLCALEQNADDSNFRPLQNSYERLQKLACSQTPPLEIRTLPMPAPVFYKKERLPVSYANFYIGNEVVLVPVFKDPKDEEALKILEESFPGRRVIGLDCRELVIGLGGIHCITQQQPGKKSLVDGR